MTAGIAMPRWREWIALIATLLVVATAGAPSVAADTALAGPALHAALLRGGYVLYFRHTSTDFGQNDDAMTTFDDCSKQRNLTDQGRAEARAAGAAIARSRIPIGEVLASPYCRTLETGRLMFGRASPTPAVRGGPATPSDPERYAGLRRLLSTPVADGTNTVIASHGNPFYGVAGPPQLAEGEAAVIEPLGGGFRIIARIPKDGWDALARQ
ncbi:MAG: histidine phosphatase family protein [Betaproteobacteria bacterium]